MLYNVMQYAGTAEMVNIVLVPENCLERQVVKLKPLPFMHTKISHQQAIA